jgi:hypothetical protein
MPGVFLGLGLLGFLLGRVERAVFAGPSSAVAMAGYAYGLALYGLAIHAGLSDFDLMVLIPLAFLWVAGVRPRWPATSSAFSSSARP